MPGKVDIINNGPDTTITIDGNTADISAGGNAQDGDVIIRNAAGNEIIRISAQTGPTINSHLTVKKPDGTPMIQVGPDLIILDSNGNQVAAMTNEGNIVAGSGDTEGTLIILNTDGSELIRIGSNDKDIRTLNSDGMRMASLDNNGNIFAGGPGADGGIFLIDKNGKGRMIIGKAEQNIRLFNDNGVGVKLEIGDDISIRNPAGAKTTVIEGGNLYIGRGDVNGTLSLFDQDGKLRIRAGGAGQDIVVTSFDNSVAVEIGEGISVSNGTAAVIQITSSGNLIAGGGGQDGDLILRDQNGKERIRAGGDEQNLVLKKADGTKVIELGKNGDISAGGGGQDGDLILKDLDGNESIRAGGAERNILFKKSDGTNALELGTTGIIVRNAGNIFLHDNDGKNRIILNGGAGDIILQNGDCAEELDISETETIESGTVVVLDQEGKLQESTVPYDKKVAGVISGAGDYKPGIILGREPSNEIKLPVALVGKVYCKVDAEDSPVEAGDLLTTSATPGHAMKAEDPARAFGAVIGKALRPLKSGRALIPILVCLQ
jgi:hypothetical protein